MKKIKYNQIEGILQDNIIFYNKSWWLTKEDIKLFPNEITLLEKVFYY